MRGVGRRPGPLTHPAARIGRRLKSVEKWDKLSAEERLPILPNKDTTIIHHKEEGLEAWVYGWSDQSFDAKEIIPLNPRVWGEPIRKDIIQRVVHYQRLKAMRGTHSSKSRSQVKGSGKKPFPQKKTGRARQGSRKAPHMWHGGAAHGPKPHSHAIDLPRKIRLMGTRIALSAKYQEGRLLIIDEAKWHTVKTGTLSTFLRQFGMRVEMTLLVYDDEGEEGLDGNLALASRMIPTLDLLPQSGLNVYTMLRHRNILITKSAVEKIEARLDPMRLANRNIRYMVGSKGGGLTYTEYIQQFKDVREKRLAIERSRAVTVLYKDPPLHIVRTLEALPKTWSKIGIGSKMTATDNNDNDNNTPSTPSTTPSTPVPNSFDATVVTASQ